MNENLLDQAYQLCDELKLSLPSQKSLSQASFYVKLFIHCFPEIDFSSLQENNDSDEETLQIL